MDGTSLTEVLKETLSLFESGGEPLATSEVAQRVGLGRRSAYERLERLADGGHLETKKVGSSGRIWWRDAAATTVGAAENHVAATTLLVEDVFDQADVGVLVLDSSCEVKWINAATERYFGLDRERVLGTNTDQRIEETIAATVADSAAFVETVLGLCESDAGCEEFECHVTAGDGREERWLKHRSEPIESGALAGGRVELYYDITERKQATHQLEHQRNELEHELREVFDRIDDAFFALDDDWCITYVNERATHLVDRPVSDVLGQDIWEAFEAAADTNVQRNYERAMETQESVTFETYYPPLDSRFEVSAYPSESGLSVYFRDVTDRVERERELEQYEHAIETIGDGVYVVDEDREFVLVNEAYCELIGYDRETLLGAHASMVAPDDGLDRGDALRAELLESSRSVGTVATELTTADGRTVPVEARFSPVDREDAGYGSVGVVRDVTERRERERELGRYESIVETVEDGIYTVSEDGVFTFVNDAHREMVGFPSTELVGRKASWLVESGVLDADVIAQARELDGKLRAGERESASIEATLSRPDGSTVETEATFNTLTTDDGHERVGVVRDVTDRVERERELERQREQLAVLNSLNRVVREVSAAVIEQSTREEIEATVCAHLADSESYLFAWVGEADSRSEAVSVRTEAGAATYLDDIAISVDPDDEYGDGPVGRAFRTGEMQAVSAAGDDQYEPWRDRADAHDVESLAAIPISYEGTMYGTLNVYADRQGAFEGSERRVIGQLGDTVGHAIAAAERKQALLSDDVVELQFVVPDVFADVDGAEEWSGQVRLQHAVSVGGDDFVVYGSAPDDAVGWLETLADEESHWEALTVHEGDGQVTFEIQQTAPPMLSAVASAGGAVEQAVIEDGDYRLAVHIPTSVDVRQVIDSIEGSYPAVQLRKRRQLTKVPDEIDLMQRELLADLTDRQHTALEMAYHAGFFEWPRNASGEQVASSLDIAATTFHHHLRKAERKVFEQVFRSSVSAPERRDGTDAGEPYLLER